MRKILIFSVLIVSAILTQAQTAHAGAVQTVHCFDCSSMRDFFLHGAASIYMTADRYLINNSDKVWVVGNGSRVFVDIDQSVYRWIGVGNLSFPIYHYWQIDISGFDFNGKLQEEVLKNVHEAVIELKWEEIQRSREALRRSSRTESSLNRAEILSRGYRPSFREIAFLTGVPLNRRDGSGDSTCYTTWNRWGSTTVCTRS